MTGRVDFLSGIKQDKEQYPPYAEVKRAIFASSVPYLFTPSAALNGMPEEKQGMYWQILDTPTLRFLSRAFGPPAGMRRVRLPSLVLARSRRYRGWIDHTHYHPFIKSCEAVRDPFRNSLWGRGSDAHQRA